MVMHKSQSVCHTYGPPQRPSHTAWLPTSLALCWTVPNADRFYMARAAAPGFLPQREPAAALLPGRPAPARKACRPSAPSAKPQVPATIMQPDSQETTGCASTAQPEADAVATQGGYSAALPAQLPYFIQQEQQQRQQQQTAWREFGSTPWRTKRSASGDNSWLDSTGGQRLAQRGASDTTQPPTAAPPVPRAPDRGVRTPPKLSGGDGPAYKFNEVVRSKVARRDMLVRGTCADFVVLPIIPAHA